MSDTSIIPSEVPPADDRNLIPVINEQGEVVGWGEGSAQPAERTTIFRIGVVNPAQTNVIEVLKPQAMARLQADNPSFDSKSPSAMRAVQNAIVGALYARARLPGGEDVHVLLGDNFEAIPVLPLTYRRSLMPPYGSGQSGALCGSSNSLRPDNSFFVVGEEGGEPKHRFIDPGSYLVSSKSPTEPGKFLPAKPELINIGYTTHACVARTPAGKITPLCPFARGEVEIPNLGKVRCVLSVHGYFIARFVNTVVAPGEAIWVILEAYFQKSSYPAGAALEARIAGLVKAGTPPMAHFVNFSSKPVGAGYTLNAELNPNAYTRYLDNLATVDPDGVNEERVVVSSIAQQVEAIANGRIARASELYIERAEVPSQSGSDGDSLEF